jgi:hydroxypyruvate reductase
MSRDGRPSVGEAAKAQPRQQLEAIYRAAIHAIQPDAAVRRALDDASLDLARPLHLIGLGKAADGMLAAALSWCRARGATPVGGVCISHVVAPMSLPQQLVTIRGDHPLASDRSVAAAELLREYVASRVGGGEQVVVLLSGGTSALIGAPAGGLGVTAYRECCALLLRSGLDIHALNALRRELSLWGNGRLGAALHTVGARVLVLAISDVPGDAFMSIGSAPCLTTPVLPAETDAMLAAARFTAAECELLRASLRLVSEQPVAEYPPIPHLLISSNRQACKAVANAAAQQALSAVLMPELLAGNADQCGVQIARQLVSRRAGTTEPVLVCWGGEPVVLLPAGAPPGGRMQALALAAAHTLHSCGVAGEGITILAAGSDGRDGTTDAAGAVVHAGSWAAIGAAGGDAQALRDAHDSHAALRLANSLIESFVSGTNVNDLVIALVEPAGAADVV